MPKRQITFNLPSEHFPELERRAKAADCMPGRYALDVVLAALKQAPSPDAPPVRFERGHKPFIRAGVVSAAARNDIPLDRFVTMLIERGFASYEADAARERAA